MINQTLLHDDMKVSEKRWVDDSTGLSCLIIRHPSMKHLCGYVGVKEGSPLFGMDYSNDRLNSIDVHGGLTYADRYKGEPKDIWWFGFDCAHSGDYVPSMAQYGGTFEDDIYWTVSAVETECTSLAEQIHAIVIDTERAAPGRDGG